MELHGLDIYIWNEDIPKLPEEWKKLKLKFISNRGTRVYPPPVPEIDLADWYQCRYLSDTQVTDEELIQLIHHLSSKGHIWTKCEKLFIDHGVNQFSEPY